MPRPRLRKEKGGRRLADNGIVVAWSAHHPRARVHRRQILASLRGAFEVQPSVEKGAEENDLMVRSGGRRNSVHGNGRRLPAAR